jgi:glycosyltransferase involved in cell wall biosynthesis
MHTDTWIIVPMYNEQKVIASVLSELLAKFRNVVAVDDGSQDSTYKTACSTKANVISHPINLGQGAAIQTGIDYALRDKNAKYFITFDSDGQHRLKDAEKMLAILKTGKFDIVLGSRFLGKSGLPLKKKLFLKTAIHSRNLFSKIKLTDIHNGLRAFNRDVAEKLNISMAGMAHASEIIDRISQYDFRYTEVPVTIKYTSYSKAKGQSLFNSVNILFDLTAHKYSRKRR